MSLSAPNPPGPSVERSILERAEAFAREFLRVANAAPDGQVPRLAGLSVLDRGRGFLRFASTNALQAQAGSVEKKGRPGEPVPAIGGATTKAGRSRRLGDAGDAQADGPIRLGRHREIDRVRPAWGSGGDATGDRSSVGRPRGSGRRCGSDLESARRCPANTGTTSGYPIDSANRGDSRNRCHTLNLGFAKLFGHIRTGPRHFATPAHPTANRANRCRFLRNIFTQPTTYVENTAREFQSESSGSKPSHTD